MMGQDLLFGEISTRNYRVRSFKVEIRQGVGRQVSAIRPLEFYFAQAGTTSNIDFFERPKDGGAGVRQYKNTNLDDYVRYDKESLGRTGASSPYLRYAPIGVDDFIPDAELPATANMGPQFWSPFATRWILEVPPYSDFSIESIEDIIIRLELTSGAPKKMADLLN